MQLDKLVRKYRPKVALDIDGTIADTHAPILEEWNRIKGKNFKHSDIDDYDWEKTKLQMPIEEFFRIYKKAWTENFTSIPPTITEQELNHLIKHFDVDIVTRRPSDAKPTLEKWLSYNFPTSRLRIITVEHTLDKLKSGHEIIIDDAPQIWAAFSRRDPSTEGKWLYAPRQPWNEKTISSMPASSRMTVADTASDTLRLALDGRGCDCKTALKKPLRAFQ
ncbi:hypothetical protein M1397_00990 [Candidatus Marsarchaeota archaeon]|jgi:5'(3')-deoxyribonucleotidase|nr:hypothetical protein [Candidatus Marsarchaeota archaeon]